MRFAELVAKPGCRLLGHVWLSDGSAVEVCAACGRERKTTRALVAPPYQPKDRR